jgi:aspartyl-tRNA(Asn)/glutamyl-tRNA(Gln) amidotransferase subunit B
MDYEYIICFETHVELNTETKLFCGCGVSYDAPPNTRICPVCTGQPGALPVLNKKAVQYAVKAGLALNCRINTFSRFARKNYFYPDLPKGYQISQYELPFCEEGYLEITNDAGQPYRVGIKRIHLEEDAGKLMHSSDAKEGEEYSLVDYNRSCVPLLEIVTDHEYNPMHSLQEARAYLEKLRQTLKYIEISECMMEKGQFRCDVNISIRPRGSQEFGNRTEVKNMSSFRFIMEALEYEIKRQKEIIESSGTISQETRLFDETKKITLPMRSKEDAPDYRYFPDPDLLEVKLDQDFISQLEKEMPELPDQQLNRIIEQYGIPKTDALILTKDKAVSEYFTACASICEDKRRLGNWIIKELFKLLNDASISIVACPVKPSDFVRLIELVSRGEVTEAIGRTILSEMFSTGLGPDSIINEKGLRTIDDDEVLVKAIEETIKENPEAASQIKAGDTKPVDFILGRVMRKTRGKADPKKVRELIGESLSGK